MSRMMWLGIVLLQLACTGKKESGERLFEDILVSPRYATGFEVRSRGSEMQIILNPSSGSSQKVVLEGPADRIACLSTTHLAMFIAIGQAHRVCAMGYTHLINDSAMRVAIDANEILNLTTGDDLDPEVLIQSGAGLMLTYPFQSTPAERYTGRNIVTLPVSEYLETHPLGRAEWVRLVGALCGQVDRADSVFSAIEARYLNLKSQAKNLSMEIPPSQGSVLFTSYENGTWFASPGKSAIAALIRDAGMDYLFPYSGATGNIPLDREQLIARATRIHWWGELVRSSGVPSFSDVNSRFPSLRNLEAFHKHQGFFCNSSESDYFGMAVVEPDVLLGDLMKIFYPEQMISHVPVYFHRMN